MSTFLKLSSDEPVVHIKAYGSVQVRGAEKSEVRCEIDSPQLASLVEENGKILVTVNATCELTVPINSTIELEKGMGSVKISNIQKSINIEKVLGNLVLNQVDTASVGKVGGNFSVRNAGGGIQVDKVAGNLVIDQVGSFSCLKVGGNGKIRNVLADLHLEKVGGSVRAQEIGGSTFVEKVGGSFRASRLNLITDLKVGGNLSVKEIRLENGIGLKAGGDVEIGLSEELQDITFDIGSGGEEIHIKTQEEDIRVDESLYEYRVGNGSNTIELAAGGKVVLTDQLEWEDDFVGDLSDDFKFEESPFSEMLQQRVGSATRIAEAKMRAAEIRLEKIREQFDDKRFDFDFPFDMERTSEAPERPIRPPQPVARPVGKKGATDEERLMILKMLEEKKITVDEAEKLFKVLDN